MQDSKEQVEILINTGFNYHQEGKLDDAEPLYFEALKLDDKNAEIYNLIGVLELQKGNISKAVEFISKAISICPSEYFYETLFQALSRNEDYEKIVSYAKDIKNSFPKNFTLLFDIALAYKNLKQNNQALKYYEMALHINPMSYEGWSNVSNIYSIEGRASDAVSAMEVCYSLRPDDDDTAYFLSVDYFKAKNYKKGLPLFEKRMSKKIAYTTQAKTLPNKIRTDNEWKGENIKDKNLYVYYEAGFGDVIMYSRYLPIAKKLCKKLTFMCPKELAPLFRINQQLGIDEIVDTFIPNNDIDIDVHASLLSLPYILGYKENNIFVSQEGYLGCDKALKEEFKQKYFNNDKIKIGIKWQGNTTFDKDRVIPAESFIPLLSIENTQYYSFQTFEGAESANKLDGIIDIGKNLLDFSQTAAALSNLDLVICNDTSLAHLAGAMRIPCWLLLPYDTNWRWHTDMTKCDWYESIKLFRQKSIGDWNSVFADVLNEMRPE